MYIFWRLVFSGLLGLFCPALFSQADSLIQPSKSWSIGIGLGGSKIGGDVSSGSPGAQVEVHALREVSSKGGICLSLRVGQVSGQDVNPTRGYLFNPVLAPLYHGDSSLTGEEIFVNYRSRYTTLLMCLQGNVNQLVWPNPHWNLLLTVGGGAMLYRTDINALDGEQVPYDYQAIVSSRRGGASTRSVREQLDILMDNSYETLAEQDPSTRGIGKASADWVFQIGTGIEVKVTPTLGIVLSGEYVLSTTDLLDGQQWLPDNRKTGNSDWVFSTSVRVMRQF